MELEDKVLLKRFLDAYHSYLTQNKYPKELDHLYYLIKGRYFSHEEMYDNPWSFITDYATLPLGQLYPFKKSVDPYFDSLKTYPIVFQGGIHEVFHPLLFGVKSVEDLQQREWEKVLHYLRHEDNRPYEQRHQDYITLRVDLFGCTPFIKRTELVKYLRKFKKHELIEKFIDQAYRWWNQKFAVLCNYCGYPMELDEYGNSTCIGSEMCSHYTQKFFDKEKRIDTSEEDYFVLEKGYYFYTTKPTKFDWHVYVNCRRIFPTAILYPDLERSGDVMISLKDREMKIDCKTHRNPAELFQHLQEDYKSVSMDTIVLPHYTYKHEYKQVLDRLNESKGSPFRFMTDKQLFSSLRRESKMEEQREEEFLPLSGGTSAI